MKILITGAAGFVGSSLVKYLFDFDRNIKLIGIDNLSRKGSESNLILLKSCNCTFFKGDISIASDIKNLPKVDWIIDCAANPSVIAGTSHSDSLDVINSNLFGTIYLLEKCKFDGAGFILISTNRVYSINALQQILLQTEDTRFSLNPVFPFQVGVSQLGINESFSTEPPISLYGATKITSEILALEYHHLFGFPVWINRCGVIAGPGQFGKVDQGIVSFWIYHYLLQRPLSFIGYGGRGLQVRDLLHPSDLFSILKMQLFSNMPFGKNIFNIGGGLQNSLSLLELDMFCKKNIDASKELESQSQNRQFDIPFYVTDNTLVMNHFNWKPSISSFEILEQVLFYARININQIKTLYS